MGKLKKQVNKKQTEEMLVQQKKIEQYSGIIPPPSVIDGYERNCPGATDRILKMTENELKNKQELDKKEQENIHLCRKKALEFDIKHNTRGQVLGFILLFTMLVGGFALVFIGKEIGGYATIVSSVSLGLGSLIWSNSKNKK